ncbi:MAG TPA: hypothetical protein DCF33_10985 [Saprospirales bacterium]|nr:hypothetical protein [Saprospirales bacterium]
MVNNHKSFFTGIILLLLAITLGAQQSDVKRHSINVQSTILEKNIALSIRLPDGYGASQVSYTVLYYIHGDPKSVEELSILSHMWSQSDATQELIVVGIDDSDGLTDRMNDPKTYDLFLSSLEKELIPAVEKQYRTNGKRILHEKSLFGSFTLYVLLTRPELCQGYIAASKQWYDENNDYFTERARKALQNPEAFRGRRIFLATLNGAYNNNNIPEVNKNLSAFADMLMSQSNKRVQAKHQAFDDWGISLHPGFMAGLKFVMPSKTTGKPKADPLRMVQAASGQWVITNRQKKTLYEVFFFDNGPDYPSEGLIRIVKNGKIGYANAKTYELVVPPVFDCAFPFENGKGRVSSQCITVQHGEHNVWESESWLLVDKKGNLSR